MRIRDQVGRHWGIEGPGVKGEGSKGPSPHADLQVCPCLPQWKQNKSTLLENSQRVTTALLARSASAWVTASCHLPLPP